jgi:hypothetical protein
MKLLHQCGHCTRWNLDSFDADESGDGLIFSPVHEKQTKIAALSAGTRRVSFFDPQYYLPNSQKAKLHSYDFFPEVIANGFSTVDFSLVALQSAKSCVAFQIDQDFDRIIIPARYYSQMDPDYTNKQEAYTVAPFLKEIGRQKTKKPVYITLPLTSHMIESAPYRTGILNWVTSFPEISGVYLIPEHERATKQVLSEPYLDEMLKLITEMQEVSLRVTVGYSNTESLLYLLTGDVDVTLGSFENTRMFSIDKFVESDEERRGPKARIYLPGLLNWVQFNQAKELRSADKKLWDRAYRPTQFAELALKQATEPTFNQSPLYRHYFIAFAKQVEPLRKLSRLDRYRAIRTLLKGAIDLNNEVADIPIDFERHGSGAHLQGWLNVINRYYAAYLKP